MDIRPAPRRTRSVDRWSHAFCAPHHARARAARTGFHTTHYALQKHAPACRRLNSGPYTFSSLDCAAHTPHTSPTLYTHKKNTRTRMPPVMGWFFSVVWDFCHYCRHWWTCLPFTVLRYRLLLHTFLFTARVCPSGGLLNGYALPRCVPTALYTPGLFYNAVRLPHPTPSSAASRDC